MVDIANSFYEKGFETSLIAGRIVGRDIQLYPGITVKKIKRYDRKSNIRRIISWIVGSIQILFILIFRFRKSHLFIVSNPPFAPLLPLFLRNEFSLLVFDVFPDAIVEYGIVKSNSIIIRLWKWANKKIYKRATHIFTLTTGMSQSLSQYVDAEKIGIIPLWTSNNFLKPIPKAENPFLHNHNLQNKFLVLYSGNFGIAHHIDLLIDLASKITDKRVMFVLIGGGPTESKIRQKVINLGLRNCLILSWQEINTLPYSLAAADLSIVTLSENATKLAIPSKVFNYMSVGSPILCITGSGSDLERLILDYNIGRSFTSDQFDGMIKYINELLDNPGLCEFYHRNSLRASTFHTSENADLITQYYV
jgi:glycosyltransferase involved in cell wall biosynthesis